MAEGVEATTTTPDLLKNTPSNIARLEDVIEHSKARHKYLAQTTSPSDGGDVRWYFCKTPMALNGINFKPQNHFSYFLLHVIGFYDYQFNF